MYSKHPDFIHGDDAGPLRRDAYRLAAMDVASDVRFAALEQRASKLGIAWRGESRSTRENPAAIRQIIAGQEIIAISDPSLEHTHLGNDQTEPVIYGGAWTSDITLAMRVPEHWEDLQTCLRALEAFDAHDDMRRETPLIKTQKPRARF